MKKKIFTLLLVIFIMAMAPPPPPFVDGFEDGTLAPFTTSGNANWIITSVVGEKIGGFGATSGNITHNQISSMQVTKTIGVVGGTVSFSSRVSSEANFDFLRFFIDGVQQELWSGIVAFATHCYPVTAGFHTFEWRYTKDGSVSTALDAAFVDDVSILDNVCAAPTAQATGLSFGTVTSSSILLNSFTAPAVCVATTGYVIKVNTVNTFTPPTNAVTLPASNTVYGGGEQVVFAGTSNAGVTVTGLTFSTQYFYKVFAYNVCAGTNTFEIIGVVANTTTPTCLIIATPAGTNNYWTGCISSDWNTATNWSTGTVPTATENVYVPVGTTNNLIITAAVTCAKMTIQIGAKCTVDYNAGGKLLIKF